MNPDSLSLELLLDQLAIRIASRLAELHAPADGGEQTGTPWMSVDTAATYLDWPRQRLYKLTAHGAIPHYKQDGRLLFHRQELDQWLAGYRQPGNEWLNGANRAISR